MKKGTLRRNALRSLLLYSIDLAIALTALTIGFGLQVQNWWAVVGLGILSRWIFHVLQHGFYLKDAREEAQRTYQVEISAPERLSPDEITAIKAFVASATASGEAR